MEIKQICVLGAGIMGAGIAQCAAQAGFDVTLRDMEDRFVENGLSTIKSNLAKAVSKGKMTADDADAIMDRVTGTTDLTMAARDADLVIEAIIEVMDVKKQVFRELDAICKKRGGVCVQYIRTLHHRNGGSHKPAGQIHRHALFQSRPGDAPCGADQGIWHIR